MQTTTKLLKTRNHLMQLTSPPLHESKLQLNTVNSQKQNYQLGKKDVLTQDWDQEA